MSEQPRPTPWERAQAARARAEEALLAVLAEQGRTWRTAMELRLLMQPRASVAEETVREILEVLEARGAVESRVGGSRVRAKWWRLRAGEPEEGAGHGGR